jgi:hypothetical protein
MVTLKETIFAIGEESSESNRMRVSFANLDRLHPNAPYPTIRKTRVNGFQLMSLTPFEAQWLVDVLTRLLKTGK